MFKKPIFTLGAAMVMVASAAEIEWMSDLKIAGKKAAAENAHYGRKERVSVPNHRNDLPFFVIIPQEFSENNLFPLEAWERDKKYFHILFLKKI